MSDTPDQPQHSRHEDRVEHEMEEIEQVENRLAEVAGRAGIGSLMSNEALSGADILRVLGGVRGLIETLAPGIAFLVAYTFSRDLAISLSLSLGLAVVFVVVRIFQRSQTRSAVAGLIAVSASAAVALFTGKPEDNYLIGLYTNSAYALVMFVSLVVGWPALGLLIGFVMGDGVAWRRNKRRYRMMVLITAIWLLLFVVRLLVQMPLYMAGDAYVEELGLARILMGTPLYAIVLVLTWMLTRAVYPRTVSASDEE